MEADSCSPYQGPIQAVVFDWAGTTVDYGCCAPVLAFVAVYRQHGVDISVPQVRQFMGTDKKTHLFKIAQIPEVARQWMRVHGQPCGVEDVEAMYRDFVRHQLTCLAEHADLIPGTVVAVAELRRRGLKIGSTTGYTREMMKVLVAETKKRGYAPDYLACSDDVPAGRPEPWMCFRNAEQFRTYPMAALVKVGDTVLDIAEGRNAGMWTIGVAKTGNELGLSEAEIAAWPPAKLAARLDRARKRLAQAGAHYVVDSIAQVPTVLAALDRRLAQKTRPR